MELLVAVLVVVGLIAIAIRFGVTGSSGPARLPRIVDDSIGMWLLRRATGRSLLGRTAGDRPDPFARFRRPSTVLAVRAQPRSAAPTSMTPTPPGGVEAPSPRPGVTRPESDEPSSVAPSSTDLRSAATIEPAASAEPTRRAGRSRTARLLGYAGLATIVGVAGFALGALLGLAAAPGASPGGSPRGGAAGQGTTRPSVAAPSAPASAGTTPSVR